MQPSDIAGSILLGCLMCLPLPLVAWWQCARRRCSRSQLFVALLVASLLNHGAWVGLYYARREPPGAYQHAQLSGMGEFVIWFGLGACQLAVLLLLLAPASWLQGRRLRASGGSPR